MGETAVELLLEVIEGQLHTIRELGLLLGAGYIPKPGEIENLLASVDKGKEKTNKWREQLLEQKNR